MRLVLMSDTHMQFGIHVPSGDMVLHAGDMTLHGYPREICAVSEFFGSLPHKHKVAIAGNHDFLFQTKPERARRLFTGATYLEDSETTIEGLRIWGSPWQPWFFDWAFNLKTEAELEAKWSLIPEGTDILITHGPPAGILDQTSRGERVGCAALRRRVRKIKPKLHVFGHIHESRGWWVEEGTLFVNAACGYRGENPPIVIEWTEDGPRVEE